MPSISDTIASFRHLGTGFPTSGGVAGGVGTGVGAGDRLTPFDPAGRNPGNLRGLIHVPDDLPAGAPLVVVLHGCTQTAAAYDRGSGWSTLADRFGFAVLYPEQQRANNPNLCFNWFTPADTQRDGGEAASIREMVVAAIERHRLDASRVFVTGLSAGGAMTSAMLATCPDLFAAGAIVAGLPYGTAAGVPQALERMRGQGFDPAGLGDSVRAASPHAGRWPAVSVWHGTADMTVSPVNAAMIVDQWRGLHGVGAPDVADRVDGHAHRAWHDDTGRLVIEEYAIVGLGHGTPIATSGTQACGIPGPHMLDAGISSTWRIAAAWGLVPDSVPDTVTVQQRPGADRSDRSDRQDRPGADRAGGADPRPRTATPSFDPGRVINDALRAAGLMKP